MKTGPLINTSILALLLGVVGDLLLRTHPWGLNAAIWLAMLAAGTLIVQSPEVKHRQTVMLLSGCAALFAIFLLWRDAWGLRMMNVFVCVFFMVLSAAVARGVRVFSVTPFQLFQQLFWNGSDIIVQPPMYLGFGIEALDTVEPRTIALTKSYGRGVLFAAPIVTVFGVLFASADPIFEGLALDILRVRWETLFAHGFFTAFFMWIAAGLLLLFAAVMQREYVKAPRAVSSRVGAIEINTVLFLVAAMFLLFVLIQIRYFFGGHAHVLESAGLTVADYARRGFFELSAVAVLTMGLLIVGDACTAGSTSRGRFLFCALSSALIGLVVLVIVSAFQKMALYVDLFGLTVSRVWVTVAIVGLLMLFVWQAVTLLWNRSDRFIGGAVTTGFVIAIALQVISPDALVARVNLNRAFSGSELDVHYATRLSADAYPALASALPKLETDDADFLRERLRENAKTLAFDDLRSWNWSRYAAVKAATSEAPDLRLIDSESTL